MENFITVRGPQHTLPKTAVLLATMHIVDTGDFVFGCLFSILAIYYLLGLFWNAPWLHTDGRRKDGRWVVVRYARYDRLTCMLAFTALALSNLDGAFHENGSGRDFIFLSAVLVCIAFFPWLGRFYKRPRKRRDAA